MLGSEYGIGLDRAYVWVRVVYSIGVPNRSTQWRLQFLMGNPINKKISNGVPQKILSLIAKEKSGVNIKHRFLKMFGRRRKICCVKYCLLKIFWRLRTFFVTPREVFWKNIDYRNRVVLLDKVATGYLEGGILRKFPPAQGYLKRGIFTYFHV